MSTRGRFITLEGLEGSGKSTQIALLRERLAAHGRTVIATREPGGTPLAERLREVVLHPGEELLSRESELLVIFAARSVHLDSLVRPALARGDWVLCDRFTDATYAYQGAGSGIADEYIRALEAVVQRGLKPDLTLLLDVPVDVGLARARNRRGAAAADRFEREGPEFFARVRERFMAIAHAEPQRVRVIDANQPVANVAQAIASEIARSFT